MTVLPSSLLLYYTAMVAGVYQTPTFPLHYGGSVKVKSQHNLQYNTKSLFRNGGHRPIIQNSHNTILTMSGKLEISYLSY